MARFLPRLHWWLQTCDLGRKRLVNGYKPMMEQLAMIRRDPAISPLHFGGAWPGRPSARLFVMPLTS